MGLGLSFVLLLASCPAASLAATARLDTTTDAQRNSRELQKQLDELLFQGPDAVMILPRGDVFFSAGMTGLSEESRTRLAELASFLIVHPHCTVALEGHSDSSGSRVANHSLSLRRADAVRSYLVSKGVDPAALSVVGKGEGSPLAENSSDDGRQWNRRVEVIIENLPLREDR
jgi:outer membrane protein OmpA-like peptidoglycan-associated protein